MAGELEDKIVFVIKALIANPEEYGFEAYAVAKTEPRLRRLIFDENRKEGSENYKDKVRKTILEAINETYIASELEIVSGNYVADNQNKLYLIQQNDEYSPFRYLDHAHLGHPFQFDDINEITGFIFRYGRSHASIWAYQHLWSIMIPNKSRSHLLTRVLRIEDTDIVAEQKEPLLTIARKVDLLVLEGAILTSNIKLLQSSFGFQEYIRTIANRTVKSIASNGIAKNPEILVEYVNRPKSRYAKKVMRISDSAVLQLSPSEIISRVASVERWQGKFKIEGDQIVLNNYSQVEDLIDLLDERYTKSEVTYKEYDTDVKRPAAPLSK